MCEALFLEAPKFPHSTFPNHLDMFCEPHISYAESEMSLNSGRTRVNESYDISLSPRSWLNSPKVEVPVNSPPPVQSTFLVWNPEMRALEYSKPLSPASPHFGGRTRLLSEVSTASTTSTDSTGLYGDASDREDDAEDAAPPVPPPTPFSFKGDDVPDLAANEAPEAPPLPAAATIEYLDRPPASSRGSAFWKGSKDDLYKTKPCKFYHKDKSCIKGDKCNFIHDEWDNVHSAPRPKTERRAALPPLSSLGRRRPDGAPREPHPDTPRLSSFPVQKNPSAKESQKVRSPNFYPITWRVIGGGVMMGGRREVCQDYMAGRCHEGTDCKYAHPGGDDEVDPSLSTAHSYMSPLSPVQEEPTYIPHDLFLPQVSAPSPVTSPVLSAPIIAPQTAHFGEERRRRGRRAKKPLTIIPPPLPEEPQSVAYSAHRVLDGSTLLELETSPPPTTALPDLSPDNLDVARTLVRPLSTPPSLHPQRPQIAKLFAAEMP